MNRILNANIEFHEVAYVEELKDINIELSKAGNIAKKLINLKVAFGSK